MSLAHNSRAEERHAEEAHSSFGPVGNHNAQTVALANSEGMQHQVLGNKGLEATIVECLARPAHFAQEYVIAGVRDEVIMTRPFKLSCLCRAQLTVGDKQPLAPCLCA